MRFVPVHAALLLAGSSSVAQAAPSRAVVVGSNRAGVGQVPLRWAGADADRVAAVLTELGGFAPEAVERLQDPSPDELIAAIDRAAEALAAEGPEGGRFVFYYSGHARSGSLTLGPDELSIDVLDLALEAVPAQQTLAVLDACQAGEPGVAKGAVPAAQFSFVSVAGLSTTGTAV
ncbi:MAG: caspase family protein, partial [Myxococcota bacterium]